VTQEIMSAAIKPLSLPDYIDAIAKKGPIRSGMGVAIWLTALLHVAPAKKPI